jgi:GDP-L-fucose synthase
MKILLLGHTGFVGKNVGEVMEKNNLSWVGASRKTGVDLRDVSQVEKLLAEVQPDFVVNCAAHVGSLNYVTQKAADVIEDNSAMVLALYQAIARKAPEACVINPIANCAYPATEETFVEDEWMNGPLHRSVLSYGATRRLLYWVGESFQMQYDIRSIYFLVPNMYGPHDSTDPNKAHALNALTAKFVKAKVENATEVEVWGTGVAIREWLYAPDFGRIVVEFLKKPAMVGLSEPLNIGQHFGLSVRELVDIIRVSCGYSGKVRYDHSKPDGAPKKVMDDKRFRKVFPNFHFTPQEEGLKACIDFYSNCYPY